MIIESGYGLHMLMFRDERDRESWEVRIVCLDERLWPAYTGPLADEFGGSLDHHAEEISAAVRQEHVRYFGIGHRVGDCFPGRDLGEFYDQESEVIRKLEDEGYVFLGHQTHDADGWSSSGPMHRFESYVLSDAMPRVLVIPGPHPFLDCACAICRHWQELRPAARDRVESMPGASVEEVDGETV